MSGQIISTIKLEQYHAKKVMVVDLILPDGTASGKSVIAIDYVGAGVGDMVLVGAAPGLAKSVFKLAKAPIRSLIMGIIDHVDMSEHA